MAKYYQSDPNRAADSEFEAGELRHLCPGNEGRLLDLRRTPVRIVALHHETGTATVEILAFEDKGGLWEVAYEKVGAYQFKKGSGTASLDELELISSAVSRFNRQVEIVCDPEQKRETESAIAGEREQAERWITEHSAYFRSHTEMPIGRVEGVPVLWQDTINYMDERGFSELENLFTRHYVSYPFDETIQAHRIAIAQIGLASYRGKPLRDPSRTAGRLSLQRRSSHVMARMGFVQAVFSRCGQNSLLLYRAESGGSERRTRRLDQVLVSSSFRLDIVQEMCGWDELQRTVALYRQPVPITRVLMTYLETEALNHLYREAEAVLIADPGNPAF